MSIKQKIEEGGLLVRVVIQIAGRPKEHVEKTMQLMIDRVKKNDALDIQQLDLSETEEADAMFTQYVDVEMLLDSLDHLFWFCFDYMPASVEIIEPRELKYKSEDLTRFINDLQERIHSLDLGLKSLSAENAKIKKNGNAMIRNMLYYLTSQSPKTVDEIAGATGISVEEISPMLEELEKNAKLIKENNKYSWKK